MGDIFHKEQRGRAMALYSFVAMLGPVLGPVCAGWYVCISFSIDRVSTDVGAEKDNAENVMEMGRE
jgi:MFS family permease